MRFVERGDDVADAVTLGIAGAADSTAAVVFDSIADATGAADCMATTADGADASTDSGEDRLVNKPTTMATPVNNAPTASSAMAIGKRRLVPAAVAPHAPGAEPGCASVSSFIRSEKPPTGAINLLPVGEDANGLRAGIDIGASTGIGVIDTGSIPRTTAVFDDDDERNATGACTKRVIRSIVCAE